MIKKIIVSLLCAVCVAAAASLCFMMLYFLLPSRKAKATITLPESVKDTEASTESASSPAAAEENADIYVADVYESLTLRTEPNANTHQGDVSLPQLTHMKLLEFTEGTEYAFVEVTSGEYKGYTGYVNKNYITKLGDHTIRVNSED